MPKFFLRSFALIALLFSFVAFIASPVAANTCNVAPSNMTAWFPLDTMSSGVAENLRSGPDGSAVNGPILVSGQVDDGWEFDGSNDYVQVADHSTLDFGTGDFSISAWIKTNEPWGIIVAKRQPGGVNYLGYQFLVAHGQLLLQIADSVHGWKNYHSSNTPRVDDGTWHHVTATVDRNSTSGVRLYIDGQLVHTFNAVPTSYGTMDNASALSIGRANDAPFSPFDGVLDEIQLYDRALTASEVAGLHASLSGGQCKMVIPSLSASILCWGDYSGSPLVHCSAQAWGGIPPYSFTWNYWGAASFSSFGSNAYADYYWAPYCTMSMNTFQVTVTDSVGQTATAWASRYCP